MAMRKDDMLKRIRQLEHENKNLESLLENVKLVRDQAIDGLIKWNEWYAQLEARNVQ